MFRQVLFTQWRWAAGFVVMLAAFGIAIPMATLRHLPASPSLVLDRANVWGHAFPILAAVTGLLIGMSAWAADHRGGHIYALTLPVPRWYYTLLRYGSGAVLVLAVGAGVWLGSLMATSGLTLPEGLVTQAGTVTVRFVLVALANYSVIFAVASGTNRTAGWILAGFVGLLVTQMVASTIDPSADPVVFEMIGELVVRSGFPYQMFIGSAPLVAL
jgi:hypothetical protein